MTVRVKSLNIRAEFQDYNEHIYVLRYKGHIFAVHRDDVIICPIKKLELWFYGINVFK